MPFNRAAAVDRDYLIPGALSRCLRPSLTSPRVTTRGHQKGHVDTASSSNFQAKTAPKNPAVGWRLSGPGATARGRRQRRRRRQPGAVAVAAVGSGGGGGGGLCFITTTAVVNCRRRRGAEAGEGGEKGRRERPSLASGARCMVFSEHRLGDLAWGKNSPLSPPASDGVMKRMWRREEEEKNVRNGKTRAEAIQRWQTATVPTSFKHGCFCLTSIIVVGGVRLFMQFLEGFVKMTYVPISGIMQTCPWIPKTDPGI